MIDPEGRVFSAILLGAGCGLKEADDYAVREAASAHFAPLTGDAHLLGTDGLVWGELTFEWHTLPATNAPLRTP